MSDWHRTPLPKKYRAVKMLSSSQRTFGDKFIPQFRLVARQLKMKPQNLVFMWNNRDAIVERAERKLPESVRNTINQETIVKINNDAEKTLKTWGRKDYKKMKMRDFIKCFDAITDDFIKLKMNS
jgi:GTPase Era involved in 16S rRNA processing|tara:strand:+ start:1591 stop:1965 length:375 start_codon:yes stop_codon:yes gene_type:complete